jgi:ribosome-binding protein aMBF1 (putative translation factor)
MSIQRRIRKFGIRKLARKIKVHPSLVSRWAKADRLPSWRQQIVMEALKHGA